MMYISDILCLSYDEVVPAIMSESNYKYHKAQGNIDVYGRGGNGGGIKIGYESLPEKFKTSVREKYGDPYVYASKQPILNALIPDHEAHTFYMGYTLPSGEKLPSTDIDVKGKPQINYVSRYTENVGWLNMLQRLTEDKSVLKRELNISMSDFWSNATELIRIKEVALPSNPRRLKDKLRNYVDLKATAGQEAAWESLIEKHKFGNNHSSKINGDIAENLLKELLSKGDDDTIITAAYNHWANENGQPQITVAAVRYRRRQWRAELLLEREGIAAVRNQLSKKILGKRPSAPLLHIESDDNDFDAYFINGDNVYYRPVLYVVKDSFNDYPLGYAWGDTQTKQLVYAAYRNAHQHVRQLTGDNYCWQELHADRWGIGSQPKDPKKKRKKTELEQFYDVMGKFIPASLHNPNSKYIEQSFGTTWHQTLRIMCRHHYKGHNVDAKTKQNTDLRDPRTFPDISKADSIIEDFIWALRYSKRKGSNKSRIEEWVEAFQASDKSKKRLLTSEERLQMFGVKHEPTNTDMPTIKADGLTPILLGEKRTYELSQQQIFQHVGKRVMIYYDPYDLSEVLVTDGKGCRFVAQEYDRVPRALADYKPGDKPRIQALQDEKKTLLPMIQDKVQERKQLLERQRIDAESRIAAGVLDKRVRQKDTRLLDAVSHLIPVGTGDLKAFKTEGKKSTKAPQIRGVEAEKNSIWDQV